MKIAFVADFHGNRRATEALEKDLRLESPDCIIGLGDYIGKGPCNDFTCDWSREHCALRIGGNWDYGCGGKHFPRDVFYWNQLGEERMAELTALPQESSLWLSGRHIRLIHGRPIMPTVMSAQDPGEAFLPYLTNEDGESFNVLLFADCHRQFCRQMNAGLILNSGSVGNALGENCCCYLLLLGEEGKERAPFEFRMKQIPYDVEASVADVLSHPDLPEGELFIEEIRTARYCRQKPAKQNPDSPQKQ